VFRDALSITISDPDHSDSEDRFIDIGMSHRMQLLVVSYTERQERIRIISADEQHGLNGKPMKKQTRRKPSEDSDTMRPEYDFSKGVQACRKICARNQCRRP
jgi:hypothetical protein